MLAFLLRHPFEFRTLVQYELYHERKHDITDEKEHSTSGWDRSTMRRCWERLDETSGGFSAVIKELDGDLARTTCLFYLVTKTLDTIEADATLAPDDKASALLSLHERICHPSYSPDADLTFELLSLPSQYQAVILDTCRKMGAGMAAYVGAPIDSPAAYDLYCHYVAGLSVEGVSALWSVSRTEAPWPALAESTGRFLYKATVVRDPALWPRGIWASGATETSMRSALVLDALRHAEDVLDFLGTLRNQSVFNFHAIPATMAMATLAECFGNPRADVRIRKAAAASLIMRSKNPREVCYIFRECARKLHARADPLDPNFLRISVACGKIEQWCERHYPSFVSGDPGASDARLRVVAADKERDLELAQAKRVAEIRKRPTTRAPTRQEPQGVPWDVFGYMLAALLVIVAVACGIIWTILFVLGED
ncbi:hypothetical protein PLICRDRAFT_42667 [Plicaturopsis crispa FD-325 SS-3]|nr:hypothetical protein PLICRDRAFT_42667 [Plicaturopsis crispa FD-325 SS-3]